jgi:hypothetical protein
VIQTNDERERYKAVFQDQFSEYKELSAEVQAVLRKLGELDAVMSRLPQHSESRQVGDAAACTYCVGPGRHVSSRAKLPLRLECAG